MTYRHLIFYLQIPAQTCITEKWHQSLDLLHQTTLIFIINEKFGGPKLTHKTQQRKTIKTYICLNVVIKLNLHNQNKNKIIMLISSIHFLKQNEQWLDKRVDFICVVFVWVIMMVIDLKQLLTCEHFHGNCQSMLSDD